MWELTGVFFSLCDFITLQEAKAAGDETRALRTRIHLAEAAQKQARGMEIDYEEVIQLLEAEIAEMKAQITDQPAHVKVAFTSLHLSLIPILLGSIQSWFSFSPVLCKVGHCLLCIIQ